MTGKGVRETADGRRIALGNAKLLEDLGIADASDVTEEVDKHRSDRPNLCFAFIYNTLGVPVAAGHF